MNETRAPAPPGIKHVLFLCTGNSARSIMAEALLNHHGAGRFRAWSAGSFPSGRVHPLALQAIAPLGALPEPPRSKRWDEFALAGAPVMDFIFTVCDNAAGEACPHWPGRPASAHWGIADPAAVSGSEADQRQAFAYAFAQLERRIARFLALPFATLDAISLQQQLQDIGTHIP